MKAKLFFILFTCNILNAQVIDVITGLSASGMSNLAVHNNYIYFNSFVEKKIYRFDHTHTTPIIELIYTFNENPNFMYVNNDILYVGVESPYKTYKIDLLSSTLQPLQIATIAGPMAQINNNLFIGQYVAGKISKLNLSTNIVTDVLLGFKPNFFSMSGNEIYFTSNYTNQLYKFDSNTNTTETILSNLDYVSGIVFKNNFLYVCESMSNSISFYKQPNYDFGNLLQLPLNSWPNGNLIVGDYLFFIQTSAGKISKFQLESALSSNVFNENINKVTVYPNPSNGIFNLKSNNELKNAKVYDLKGNLIINSKIENNKINLSNFSNGSYVLEIDEQLTKMTIIKK